MNFKKIWDTDTAMQILASPTVDSETWAEAVEWLLLNGPKEIRKTLLEASMSATLSSFPELKPSHYTEGGHPVYKVKDLAEALGITEDEARVILAQKVGPSNLDDLLDEEDTGTIH